MERSNYYNNLREQDDPVEVRKKKRRYQIDVAVNWTFIVLLAMFGYQVLEYDVDTYQSEKIYVRMLNDGVKIEEVESPYVKAGMERNLKYIGSSKREFFFAKWIRRMPVYLGLIILPLIVAQARVLNRRKNRFDKFYYPLVAVALLYGVYYWGRIHNFW
jgi:hypothetical protein